MLKKEKRSFKIPHTYVLLFIVIIIAALLTYIIPSGTFDRIEDPTTGRIIIDVDSFKYIKSTPVSPLNIFSGVHLGMVDAANIIFFIFILAGSFEVIQSTGVIDAGISKILNKFGHKKIFLLCVISIAFSVGGGTIGMSEETLVFIPIMISLFNKLGYDDLVGAAVVIVGSRVGFVSGLMNPFTVGVAQGISELPMLSGLWYRFIWYIVILIISLLYMIRYANMITNNPEKSLLKNHSKFSESNIQENNLVTFTKKHMYVGLTIIIGFLIMMFGIIKYQWYMTEIAGIFLAIGILSGLVANLSPNEIASQFVSGAKEMTFGALVVGVATTVLVMLESGNIIDTIIYSAGNSLSKLPKVLAANGMFLFQLVLNILVPSGSGQAAATMPIMAPLADVLDITRQTAVTAFHYGDGFTNIISPTNGTLMASLAIAGISYDKWVKWMYPLFIVWIIIGILSVSISAYIGVGPF